MLPARLRSASGWSDACILNISSGGMLIFSKGEAEPGSRVEIRRSGSLVIARVAWRENQRIGLSSDGPIQVAQIISPETAMAAADFTADLKKTSPRPARRRPDGRARGRRWEFFSAVAIGSLMAVIAAESVWDSLARPLESVRIVLAAR